MKKVLVTGLLSPEAKQRLEGHGLEVTLCGVHDLEDEKEFVKKIVDFDIYISGGYEKTTAQVIEVADKLKLIAFLGVECDAYIDVPSATAKGIKVCNTPGANAVSVAEFAIGLMIDAQRRITAGAFSLLHGDGSYSTSRTVYGKTVGLIGMGPIGLRMAMICSMGLSADVLYYSRTGEKKPANAFGAKFANLDELVASSDIISLQIPAKAGVILDQSRLAKLKPGCTLINISSAQLCDPKALLKAFENDQELYAAFDCFYEKHEEESEPAIKALRALAPQRLLITPHVAWRTFESDRNTYEMALKSVSDFIATGEPSNAVN